VVSTVKRFYGSNTLSSQKEIRNMNGKKEVEKEVEEEEAKLLKLLAERLVKLLKGKATAYIAIVLFGIGGGTSPLWYDLFARDNKPELQAGNISGSESRPTPGEDIAKHDRSEIESLKRQLEEALADLRRERRKNRYYGRGRDKDRRWTGVSESGREVADSGARSSQP
jgi:hypothetical protein